MKNKLNLYILQREKQMDSLKFLNITDKTDVLKKLVNYLHKLRWMIWMAMQSLKHNIELHKLEYKAKSGKKG